jgi:orotate phosphoribosyltransferase-like protein
MNDLKDLINKAQELREKGLRSGEIADELNISRETATCFSPAPRVHKSPCQRTYT